MGEDKEGLRSSKKASIGGDNIAKTGGIIVSLWKLARWDETSLPSLFSCEPPVKEDQYL